MKRLTGIGASRGVAIGKVHFIDNVVKRVECDTVVDTVLEMERFEEARLKAIEMLEELHQKAKNTVGPEESIIFEIHQLLLRDNDYVNSVHELIAKSHYSAAYAAQQTGERFAQMFSAMEDAYLRERSADMIDISSRVVRLLQGEAAYDVSQIKGQIIIAAKDLLPSETIQLDRDRVLGFVTSGGSQVSHSSILARTMGIPSVIGLGDQLAELVDGDMIVLDGFNGVLIANPPDKLLKDYHCKQAEYQLYRERLQTLKGVPSRRNLWEYRASVGCGFGTCKRRTGSRPVPNRVPLYGIWWNSVRADAVRSVPIGSRADERTEGGGSHAGPGSR